jgi:malate dehydrogenase (oxaloacetate-decarboxylating)(NADP+)
MSDLDQEALEYHYLNNKPGKLEIRATKPLETQKDLALAYSPGVAAPVIEIERDPSLAYKYTARGNLVGVISNGTAILGLGNRGALASKPVMEGKAVLFKKFADIDVFDIEVDEMDTDKLIAIVKSMGPTFGGINLEDIKAPECFEIERTLKAEMDIPVFHDDQHGTAIIASAGLLNALVVVGKNIEDIKIAVSGAGASALSCAGMAILLGVKQENIFICDSRGVLYKGREAGMNKYKEPFVIETEARTLADAMVGADVFYGLSVGDVVTQSMVKTMAKDPIIFAMANPDPEIKYDLAMEARPDAIMATGRSDYPNQVNNVLGFPFIFRGALDVQASAINDEMKMAATLALADLAKEDVPDSVLIAYGVDSIKFGKEYIIPKPFDPRVFVWVSAAVAEAAMKSGVARRKVDIEEYKKSLYLRQGKSQEVLNLIQNKAKTIKNKKRIVFAEGEERKIIRAASQVQEEGIGIPVLLGRPGVINEEIKALGLDFEVEIIDHREFSRIDEYVSKYFSLRNRKGINKREAVRKLRNKNVFGSMMVKMGDADALVSGLGYEYPEVIRPALEIHHTAKDAKLVAGVYIMIMNEKVYLFSDATVNIDPSAEDLAEIASLAADFAETLGITPRVAMLSFSNFGATPHPLSIKVMEAVKMVKKNRPKLQIDGEMQADTAVVSEIVENRFPFSEVKDANVLIFPSLDSANISYKLLNKLGNAKAIGPILLGMGAPVHVLQTGDEVRDIVNIAAVAAIDADSRK